MSDANAITVPFQGVATIQNIDALRMRVLEALEHNDRVTIDCSAVEEVDVAFIQMLLAVHLSAEHAGKSVYLTESPPPGRCATPWCGGGASWMAAAEFRSSRSGPRGGNKCPRQFSASTIPPA